MFFRKRRGSGSRVPKPADIPTPTAADAPTSATADADSGAPVSADQALDFLAELLRSYGEYAFEIDHRSAEEIEAHFEAWARHLLVGLAPPLRDSAAAAVQAATAAASRNPQEHGGRRDLPGLRLAFREQRKREHAYVTTSLGQFREAAWSFISGLRRSLTAEQSADRRIGHRMRRLESAIRGGEAARIRSEAQETVQLLSEFLAERGSRQQAQIREMAARLESLRDELDHARAQAAIDGLTGLYNRAAFDEQIEREIDLATLFGRHPCLILIDIDHFKWINDNRGHPCGDEVLRQFAATLSRCFMRRDDFLARFGGEEFVVVLRDIDIPTASELAERAMNTIRNLEVQYGEEEEPLRVTASMGLARLRASETSASWIERTDRALYQAKDLGRDRVETDPIDAETR
jgi:diguanylate cyclase (GGDEF)-like protein